MQEYSKKIRIKNKPKVVNQETTLYKSPTKFYDSNISNKFSSAYFIYYPTFRSNYFFYMHGLIGILDTHKFNKNSKNR